MLKYEVDTVEGLDAAIAGMYDKTESGKFRLKVEGIEDTTGLKKKVDELLAEKKSAAQKAKEAEELARKASEESARKSGDVDALDRSRGMIVGAVELVGCEPAEDSPSPWATTGWAWKVEGARRVELWIPWTGQLGLLHCPPEVAAQLVFEDGK